MVAPKAEDVLSLLTREQQEMVRALAASLCTNGVVLLDEVVAKLPDLGTEKLDLLRDGLESLFEAAGEEMDVPEEVFVATIARSLVQKTHPTAPKSRAATREMAMAKGGSARAQPDVRRPVGRELANPAQSRLRKSKAELLAAAKAREMRECTFAPRQQSTAKCPQRRPSLDAEIPFNRGEGNRVAARARRALELAEAKQREEERECTFKPKINPCPKFTESALSPHPFSPALKAPALRSGRLTWEDSLRGETRRADHETGPARCFFSPPRRDFGETLAQELVDESPERERTYTAVLGHHVVTLRY